MSIGYKTPLSAFCSFNGNNHRFRTDVERIHGEVEGLLESYGLSADVRRQIAEALGRARFDEGFRFELGKDGDPQRVVVYAASFNKFVDSELLSLSPETPQPATPGAWELP